MAEEEVAGMGRVVGVVRIGGLEGLEKVKVEVLGCEEEEEGFDVGRESVGGGGGGGGRVHGDKGCRR